MNIILGALAAFAVMCIVFELLADYWVNGQNFLVPLTLCAIFELVYQLFDLATYPAMNSVATAGFLGVLFGGGWAFYRIYYGAAARKQAVLRRSR